MDGLVVDADDSSEKDESVVDELRETFDDWIDVWNDARGEYIADTKFVWEKGAQWADDVKTRRKTLKQPMLEMNQLPQFIKQVTNDQRQNRPSIRVRPTGSGAKEESAELLSGLIRGIEYESNAAAAYDTAFECATTGGLGYFYVATEYEADGFDQVLKIKRCANPMAVVLDPNYTEADGSDAMGGFIFEDVPRDEFKRQWPKAKLVDFDDAKDDVSMSQWFKESTVTVATAYRVEITKRRKLRLKLPNPDGTFQRMDVWEDELPPGEVVPPEYIERERDVEKKVCRIYKISGKEELEPSTVFPSKSKGYVPIIPVFGDETNIEGKRIIQGLIRRSKDAQMMANYFLTVTVERAALTPKAPYVGFKGQFKDPKWKSVNERSWPYLEAEALDVDGKPMPLPQRQSMDMEMRGVMEMSQMFSGMLRSTMGLYEASLGQKGNEVSGKAILAREKQGDTSTFHFIDNLSRAIRYCGKVLVDAIPVVYDTQRIIRLVGEDGEEKYETVNTPTVQSQDHPSGLLNDVVTGEFDVVVDTGPSFATKRTEAVEAMSEYLASDPSAAPLIGDIYVGQMDWPMAKEIAARLKTRVPPQVLMAEQSKDPKVAMAVAPFQQQLQQFQQQMQGMGQQLQQLGQENQGLKLKLDANEAKAQAEIAKAQAATMSAQTHAQAEMAKSQNDTQASMVESGARQERASADREIAITDRFEKKIDLMIAMMTLAQKQDAAQVAAEAQQFEPIASGVVDAAP